MIPYIKMNKKIDILIIILNIFFFTYYSIQLLVFTDEFALANLGFFNHAIAGLSEIIGIIFITFVISLILVLFRNIEKQLPFFICILIFQLASSINFWRYVLTDSPGETDINIILNNAIIFSIITIFTIILVIKNFKKI